MTNVETVSKAVLEIRALEEDLKTLRIIANCHAERFSLLGSLLANDPARIVFDEQVYRVEITMEREHFTSKDYDIFAIKELVRKIRAQEERLVDLKTLLR